MRFLDLYAAVLFMGFFMIPFAYFYGEERADIYDIDYIPTTEGDKYCKALKYTLFFVGFISIFLAIALIYRPGNKKGIERGKEVEWVKQLFDVDHIGESAISFCIAIFSTVGTLCWVIYSGYGLGCLPLFLLKGEKSLQQTKNELTVDLSKVRERTRNIQEKYQRSH